jgi:hypothetical protein
VYCNGRPYVLRDASHPFQTLALSDRATNLEDIERRLKLDILEESRKFGGMILTHDEVSNGNLIPTWMSVDEASIRTPKEVYEDIKREGWRVEYHRIPIAPDRPIEVSLPCRIELTCRTTIWMRMSQCSRTLILCLRLSSSIVAWGLSAVSIQVLLDRSSDLAATFGMCAALLMRRKQVLSVGLDDPFPSGAGASGLATVSLSIWTS